jgi:hypothetical protein
MDLLERVWKFLENLSLLHWLIALILIIGGFVIYFWKWIKLQFRFGKNLKRKIYFLKLSNDKNLETEKDQIRNLALFNIEDEIKDISKDTILKKTQFILLDITRIKTVNFIIIL